MPAALAGIQSVLDVHEEEGYNSLIRRVPGKVRLDHATNDNDDQGRDTGLRFSRDRFTRDVLFTHRDGFRFKPRVFTKSTKGLKDESERIPSVSAKEHLPYFKTEPFVADLIDYQRLAKMRSTYVGHPSNDNEEATGFWKYIHNGVIHPSFLLHATVTGRSSSRDPNAQNFPKRGKGRMKDVVKAFRRVFAAPPGWVYLEADLSQIELRILAWMSGDPVMLEIYRNGGDIHSATAAAANNMTLSQFAKLPDEERDMLRFQAKAI